MTSVREKRRKKSLFMVPANAASYTTPVEDLLRRRTVKWSLIRRVGVCFKDTYDRVLGVSCGSGEGCRNRRGDVFWPTELALLSDIWLRIPGSACGGSRIVLSLVLIGAE